MWIWNKMLASIISASILAWVSKCSEKIEANSFKKEPNIENIEVKNIPSTEVLSVPKVKKNIKKQITICLNTDDSKSFTHKKVLEWISDPENTILEYPLWQLFQTYWDRPHPARVSQVERNFRTLLWEWWIESLMGKISQKLSKRWEQITSDTKYAIDDTLRFPLINPLLKDDFPQYLPDQLKEEGFEDCSDDDALVIDKIINWNNKNRREKSDFIYDIVVKKVPSWKSALALYRDWKLFMVTYASIWKDKYKTRNWKWKDPRTKMWQFKIIAKDPYKRSIKHQNAPMSFWLNFYWWYWIHQWKVTWYPASHWCVRVPTAFVSVLFSLGKDAKNIDVFISKNLYKSKK